MNSRTRRPLRCAYCFAVTLITPVEDVEASVLSDWVLRAGTLDPQRGRVLNKCGYAEMVQRPGIVELNIQLLALQRRLLRYLAQIPAAIS